jgi:hypothetical protein
MEEPEKGTVLYKKASGSLVIYDGKNEADEYLAHVKEPNGTEYDSQLLGSILARGYWEAVYIPESDDKV